MDWPFRRCGSTFGIDGYEDTFTVFTTRPDTLFGATYAVLAPEHPFVDKITTAEQKDAVQAYIERNISKSDLERTDLAKEKTGVFTGAYAINPVNGEKMPIWIADYVLMAMEQVQLWLFLHMMSGIMNLHNNLICRLEKSYQAAMW